MKILIIRHGDPDYSVDNLTPKGRIEAQLLVERMRREGVTHIYCSPLGRAQATAAPTAAALGLPVVTHDWLREFPAHIKTEYRPDGMCPWELRPNHWSDIEGLYGKDSWKTTEPFASSRCPAVFENIGTQLDALLARHGFHRAGLLYDLIGDAAKNEDVVAFFCHHGLGLALISHILCWSLAQAWSTLVLAPTSVTEFRMEIREDGAAKPYGFLRGRCIGDISHLYDMAEKAPDRVPQL